MRHDDFHPLSFYPLHDYPQKPRTRLRSVDYLNCRQRLLGLEQRRVPRPSRFVEHPDPFPRCSARRFLGAELEPPDRHSTSGGTNFNT